MLSLDSRVLTVVSYAWRLLPPIKKKAVLSGIGIEDLGARHGSYTPDDGRLSINAHLFGTSTPDSIQLFDITSHDPPQRFPCVSRALATTLHEFFHAIGAGTGLDQTSEWVSLSGFVQAWDDPQGTGRYCERRPGWPLGFSAWRYTIAGTFFTREYGSKSPAEDFADCCTHMALQWHDVFLAPERLRVNALAKLAYLRREVWGEKGLHALHAAARRWHARRSLHAVRTPGPVPDEEDEDEEDEDEEDEDEEELERAIHIVNDEQRRHVLLWLPLRHGRMFDHNEAVEVLALAIGPRLLRRYKRQWVSLKETLPVISTDQVAMIQRAAASYVRTTEQQLHDAMSPTLPAEHIIPRINRVYERSNTARAQQLAATEVHRMTQAAQEAVWLAEGEVAYKVWRTTSAQPCSFCAALEGTRRAVGAPFFVKGATMMDGTGKTRVLDYEDVYTPPIHPHCACELAEA